MLKIFVVFLGGGLGAMSRYFVTTQLAGKLGNFPIGTLAVNILGSFLIGIVTGFFIGKLNEVSEVWRIFFAVGFLGGFSTLASFSIETVNLFQSGNIFSAVLNIILTFSTGIIACAIGLALMKN
ncbi:MAG: fluoride efflux transporter CrcB [Selenomonadaceae bacterium]|nr:fluoride efflux transporter CrcB [Selenomonadaceae bacterium]